MDSEDETHTLRETQTPEEVYSESEDEENDSENEDQSQCLAMEVDNPETF